ncbi:hypothetical protein [Comamonas sp. JUb58]|uniref:hypothetical protein n=1 Tax=Comamonas sp. JUb58 TaxID=2485114 RepID=UPI001060C6E7|nr:hypothetical protein [Comamonas sp. JUb58]
MQPSLPSRRFASALQQQRLIDSIYSLGATPTLIDRQAFISHHAREQTRFASLVEDVRLTLDEWQ